MQHPRFREGELTTGFIAEEYPEGFHGAPADEELIADLAAIAGDDRDGAAKRARADQRPASQPDRAAARPQREDRRRRCTGCTSSRSKAARWPASTAARLVEIFGRWRPGQRLLGITVGGRQRTVQVDAPGPEVGTRHARRDPQGPGPRPHVAELSVHMIEKAPPDLSRILLAPMPGLLTRSTSASATRSRRASRSR